MPLRCGIVGLPNAGKSTLFNALTASAVPAESYPFCTIEPNVGVVPVPDARLDRLFEQVRPERKVPATLELVDIAGLVRGASKGEGLGNQFLAHIRETDAIVHVVRCFEEPDVPSVEAGVDPVRDVETVETELELADLDTLARRLDKARRAAKGEAAGGGAREDAAFLERLERHLGDGRPARRFEVPDDKAALFRDCHLLTAKPVLYVANVGEEALAEEDAASAALAERAARDGAAVIRLCGKVEAELAELDDAEKRPFLEALGLKEPGLHRLARETYRLLGLVSFFTVGEKEVRAWTVRRGTPARRAAGVIHTDFERHFVKAEVTSFEDFAAAGGEVEARARGVARIEGRSYVIQDGDVVRFRTSR